MSLLNIFFIINAFTLLGFSLNNVNNKNNEDTTTHFSVCSAFSESIPHIDSIQKVAISYINQGKNDSALLYLLSLEKKTDRAKDPLIVAKIYNMIGIAYQHQANYSKGAQYLNEAVLLFRLQNDSIKEANVIINLGNTYLWQGVYEEALLNYLQALSIIESSPDLIAISNCYNNIGLVYLETNQYEKALEFCIKPKEIRKSLGNIQDEINSSLSIGVIYTKKKNYAAAKKEFIALIKKRKSVEDLRYITATYSNLGHMFLDQKNIDSSLFYYSKGIQLAKEDSYAQVGIYQGMARCYIEKSNYNKALDLSKKALNISEENNLLQSNIDILGLISDIYVKLNQFEKGLEYNQLKSVKKDSLFSIKKHKELELVRLKFDFSKREKLLRKEKEIRDKRLFYISFGAAILLLLLILALWTIRILKIKKNQELQLLELNELKLKNELKTTNLSLQKKNQQLRQYIESLIKKDAAMDSKIFFENLIDAGISSSKEIDKLNSLFKLKILTDDDWKIFILHFNNYYPYFLNALETKFNNLTKAETRLILLLKLGYSRIDMANILGISENSVKKSRQRLRKKLNLLPEVKLEHFISIIDA